MEVWRGVLEHEDLCWGVDGGQGDPFAVPAHVVRCVTGSAPGKETMKSQYFWQFSWPGSKKDKLVPKKEQDKFHDLRVKRSLK